MFLFSKLLLAILVVALGGMALAAQPRYEELYPYSAEVCAVTQKKEVQGHHEKFWGHITLIVNGACRDQKASFPQLKICDPDKSVIVSVNSFLKNVMWLAADGRNFAFRGDLLPGERLGREQYDRTLKRAVAEGVFTGIEIHEDKWDKKLDWNRYLGKNAVDTDFAINFGRDAYCSRLPMPKEVAQKVVDHLNEVNRKFASKMSEAYRWNPIFWNCAHLVNNTLSSVGLASPLNENVGFPRQIFNLGVPGNVVLEFADLQNETRWIDPVWAFKQAAFRGPIEKFGWLPSGPGSDFKFYPRVAENDLYEDDLDIFVLDFPFGSRKERLLSYRNKSGAIDFEKDLNEYQGLYSKAVNAVSDLRSGKIASPKMNPKDSAEFAKFLDGYEKHVRAELGRIESRLLKLATAKKNESPKPSQATLEN